MYKCIFTWSVVWCCCYDISSLTSCVTEIESCGVDCSLRDRQGNEYTKHNIEAQETLKINEGNMTVSKKCCYSTIELNDAEIDKMPDSDHKNLLVRKVINNIWKIQKRWWREEGNQLWPEDKHKQYRVEKLPSRWKTLVIWNLESQKYEREIDPGNWELEKRIPHVMLKIKNSINQIKNTIKRITSKLKQKEERHSEIKGQIPGNIPFKYQ